MDRSASSTAGVALLTIVFIEYGGAFLYRTVTQKIACTDFQRSFFRAGHAHAGVLVILGLVSLLLVGSTELTGVWRWLGSTGALVAAVLMPAGFFFGAMGAGRTTPNRFVALLPAGAAVLGAAVVTLGWGLFTAS